MTEQGFEGRRLGGRYHVGRLLGMGSMGAVYDAMQEDLGRRVALKVLHPDRDDDPALLQRFRREAQAAAALGHPNIVQVTDFQMNPGEPPFLVMEHLGGESLRDILQRELALDPPRVAFIFAQVLSALSAAHGAGIVHRDIKPANIILLNTLAVADLAKIVDFGVAKLLNSGSLTRTAAGTVLGTLRYMSPEQAAARDVDTRTDIYAVGACMFHAISGRRPIEAASAALLIEAIQIQVPPPLHTLRPDVDPTLSAIVARALEKDPNRRFATAEEMATALSPWTRSPTHSAPPRSVWSRSSPSFAVQTVPDRIASVPRMPPVIGSTTAVMDRVVLLEHIEASRDELAYRHKPTPVVPEMTLPAGINRENLGVPPAPPLAESQASFGDSTLISQYQPPRPAQAPLYDSSSSSTGPPAPPFAPLAGNSTDASRRTVALLVVIALLTLAAAALLIVLVYVVRFTS